MPLKIDLLQDIIITLLAYHRFLFVIFGSLFVPWLPHFYRCFDNQTRKLNWVLHSLYFSNLTGSFVEQGVDGQYHIVNCQPEFLTVVSCQLNVRFWAFVHTLVERFDWLISIVWNVLFFVCIPHSLLRLNVFFVCFILSQSYFLFRL
jgi:hypothetical protein